MRDHSRAVIMSGLMGFLLLGGAIDVPAQTGSERATDPPRARTFARTIRHPRVAKLVRLEWANTVVPPTAVTANVAGKPPTAIDSKPLLTPRKHGARPRPMPTLIFAYDPSFTYRELAQLEGDVFGEETIVLGCHVFRLFKAPARPYLPAGFYVLDANGRVAALLALNTRRVDLVRALTAVHDGHYATPRAKFIADYRRYVDTLEAAADRASVEPSVKTATALARIVKRHASVVALKRKAAPGEKAPPKK